jgi:hypothetical protein
MHQFYKEVSPDVPYHSVTTAVLSSEARADLLVSTEDLPPPYESKPLRLLSLGQFLYPQNKLEGSSLFLLLDGGGVRGVSTLRILKKLMEKISQIENSGREIKPCEYFDVMAGTSTGG